MFAISSFSEENALKVKIKKCYTDVVIFIVFIQNHNFRLDCKYSILKISVLVFILV